MLLVLQLLVQSVDRFVFLFDERLLATDIRLQIYQFLLVLADGLNHFALAKRLDSDVLIQFFDSPF